VLNETREPQLARGLSLPWGRPRHASRPKSHRRGAASALPGEDVLMESDEARGAEGLDPGLARALESLGDRWSPHLVAAPLAGPPHFTAPRQRLPRTGRDLNSSTAALSFWGGPEPSASVHGRCGSRMESRWYCPTCQEMVAAFDRDEEGTEDDVVYT